MTCPKCGIKYACPCEACVKRKAGGDLTPWPWDDNGMQSCAGCGLTKSLDEWLDEEVRQMKAANGGKWPGQK